MMMKPIALALLAALCGASALSAQVEAAIKRTTPPSRFDLAGGYDFIRANAPPAQCDCFVMNGAFLEGDLRLKRWIGVAGEVSGGHAKDISPLGQSLTLSTFMGGPRISLDFGRIGLFGEGLVGAARGTGSYFPSGTTSTSSATSLAYSGGGGIDITITPRISIRAFNAQFLHTAFPNGAGDNQRHLQIGTGVVFRFGVNTYKVRASRPEPMPLSKAALEIHLSCSASTQEVTAGSPVQILCNTVTAPVDAEVAYTWSAGAGKIQGQGRAISVDTTDLPTGSYHVTGHASLVTNPEISADSDVVFRVIGAPAGPSQAPPEDDRPLNSGDADDFQKHVRDLFFAYDSSHVRPDDKQVIADDAVFLNAHEDVNITLAGYADERGSAEYNLALGYSRAAAAREALVAAGVAKARIEIMSFGKEKPFCTEEVEACFQQNRRAQLVPRHK